MRLSDAGLATIKRFEGLRLDAYPDPGSKDGLPVTIGYGSTRKMDGSRWSLGDRITEQEAEEILRRDLEHAEATVLKSVKVPLAQAQFDALSSLVHNIGAAAFESSTLVKRLNSGDYEGAAEQFAVWRLNDGKVMPGLVNRREIEAEMFRSGTEAPAPVKKPIVVEQDPAPIVESKPIIVSEKPVMAVPIVLKALFPALVEAIPGLIRQFGDGRVTDRNANAAKTVLDIVQSATGAANAQEAIESITTDQAARSAAVSALAADHWLDLTEAGGGGIEGARNSNAVPPGTPVWQMPALWITAALLPLIYLVAGSVLLLDRFSDEMRGIVVGVVLTGALGSIISYWLGSSIGSKQSGDAVRSLAQMAQNR